MKNFEKYRTVEARSKAFGEFCRNTHCGKCPAHVSGNECEFVWLEFDAADEAAAPCPFCGCLCRPRHGRNDSGDGPENEYWVKCDVCSYVSGTYGDECRAVAAHNRVAKAAAAAGARKEGAE